MADAAMGGLGAGAADDEFAGYYDDYHEEHGDEL